MVSIITSVVVITVVVSLNLFAGIMHYGITDRSVYSCQQPEQIHLSLTGDPTQRMISFVVQSSKCPSEGYVVIGTPSSHGFSDKFNAKCITFGTGGHVFAILYSKITGLKANETYFYQAVASSGCHSDVYNFTTIKKIERYAVYGDFGIQNDVSLNQLVQELRGRQFDMVLHVGDIAYDLHDHNGKQGDKFLRAIQPLTATTPYMVLPGNHEHYKNFTHYRHRYVSMIDGVGATSGSNTNLWYSFDVDNVHFVAIDTELYAYFPDKTEMKNQVSWLEKDLIKANANRHKTPWIIMLAHKAWWMDRTDFSSFTPLLHKYGVDLFICGHQHNYQRLYPTYKSHVDRQKNKNYFVNPKYATVLVVGSPGNREKISFGHAPKKSTVFQDFEYGYGHMIIYNRTHLYWEWEKTGDRISNGAKLLDHMWLVQEHHGMRKN